MSTSSSSLLSSSSPHSMPQGQSHVLARRSEWLQGHLLYSTTLTRKPRTNLSTQSIYINSDPQKTTLDLDGGTTEAMHAQGAPYFSSQSSHVEKALPARPLTIVQPVTQRPWHMPMLSSLMIPVSNLLHRRVHEHFSVAQVLLMAGYSTVILYAIQYKSIPFIDFDRSGWVSVSQLPLVYALATKNNVIGMLVGVGYEKLNYLHRFAGGFAILAANIHAIGYCGCPISYLLRVESSPELLRNTFRRHRSNGLWLLYCAFEILGIFSMQGIRSKSYNLFFVTHFLALTVILVSVCYHCAGCLPYVVVAGVFYAVDHLVRGIKTRITTATLRPIPELGLTRVEMPSINAGWRVGQHVRLRVLSTSMGFWGLTEIHPFTIANVNRTEEGLVLLCKKAGRWTNKMYQTANTSAYGERGQELGRTVKVMVEGPYGGLGNTVITSYSGAMLVVGGSGVTFALASVQEFVRNRTSSNISEINVIWCIADPGSFSGTHAPLFTALISESASARLRISVFYTRASSVRSFEGMYLPPGITLAPGRPNLNKHLGDVVNATLGSGGCTGVFVGVCGPVSLAGSVSETVRRFDTARRRAVGGVEVHEEVFGW
ncbi:hypothetical protein JVU11DRAFT_9752 [Chiua virens]|nr:hypothetical protein JVU11DRAFT_9752 [Chiua virens]